ncbi:hypothetical protein LXL04_011046 [Taraxacum kok-saghyz]
MGFLKICPDPATFPQATATETDGIEQFKYANSDFSSFGERGNWVFGIGFQHRQSSFKELQYRRDGDSNGVLYYVGTSYGKHQWVNPVLAKKISITASNPISRYTDAKVLASRTYQGISFAGPRIEDGRSSWSMIDLGLDHQGSSDGKNWTNLRVHENDQTLSKPGQFASWAVTGPNALLPFRYFRKYEMLIKKDPFMKAEEGKESVADVASRLTNVLLQIESQFQECAILIVSHGDPLQILQTVLDAFGEKVGPEDGGLASQLAAVKVPSFLSQHRKHALLTRQLRAVEAVAIGRTFASMKHYQVDGNK